MKFPNIFGGMRKVNKGFDDLENSKINKKIAKLEQSKTKDGKLKESEKRKPQFSSTKINILIKRQIAENLLVTVAEFNVDQIKDKDFNLVLKNAENKFKEDFNFDPHQVILHLEMRLSEETKEKQNELIQEKIKEINADMKNICDGYKFTEEEMKKWKSEIDDKEREKIPKQIVNIIDLQIDLKFYQIYLERLESQGKGSYEEINSKGQRQICFLAKDGVLIPIFNNLPKVTAYADTSAKRKLFYDYSDRNELWLKNQNKNPLGDFFFNMVKFAFLILFVVFIFGTIRNQEMAKENTQIAQSGAKFLDQSYLKEFVMQNKGDGVSCAYYYTELMKMNGMDLMGIRNRLANMSLLALESEVKKQENIQDISRFTKGLNS